jgi:hypothetical protein
MRGDWVVNEGIDPCGGETLPKHIAFRMTDHKLVPDRMYF